jgi:hypothetical protein
MVAPCRHRSNPHNDCIQELPLVLVELNIQTVYHKCVMDHVCKSVNRVNVESFMQKTKVLSQKS